MTAIDNVDELNKILRAELVYQSELPADCVRNGVSLHGSNLDKKVADQIFKSIEHSDVTIIYELSSRNSSSDMSETEDNDSITYYSSYTMHVILYGNSAPNVARKLIARLRTDACGLELWQKGVYVEEVTNPTELNEFVNNSMWIRSDFDINVSCKMTISQISSYQDMENLDAIVIKDI